MKKLQKISLGVLILGGINWGLWGMFDFNLIEYVVGSVWVNNVLYFLIGVSAVCLAVTWKCLFGECSVRKK